ncbi:hypothetical protein [Actinoplanes siamensis]|uniref:Uncharacterized protein n=1 Tax=Actinoplanes siamensis TaxID=1223317 RepID=A0A919NA83_9ACTN|nr:hypothetical protein [Actinoplanes siamensis]GIF07064.1 hypothetical protein Asi03nite_46020 [Actinoplanes siamensis]
MTWQTATTGMVSLVLLGIIVTVVIAQLGATWRAKASADAIEGYRRLAEEARTAEQQLLARLGEVKADLEHLRTRSDEVYRMLRDVQ